MNQATRFNNSLAALACTPLQAKAEPFQLTKKVRSTKTVRVEGELDFGSYHGLGVLQQGDLDIAMSVFTHRIFVKHHFTENRLTKWLDSDMHVFQIHHAADSFTRVHGTIITDGKMDLVAYCVENNVPRQARGNKDKVIDAIKKICRYESYAGKF